MESGVPLAVPIGRGERVEKGRGGARLRLIANFSILTNASVLIVNESTKSFIVLALKAYSRNKC